MSKLYKYQKVTDQYTTYTLITPENDPELDLSSVELGTIDGETYVLIPESETLPENQPEQIYESIVYIGDGYDKQGLINNFKITRKKSLYDRKVIIATSLNQVLGSYIYGYYDSGTQQTFQALLQIDTVSIEKKTLIKTIFPWIQLCLTYYYSKKTEVINSNMPELITWDFTQFDAVKPDVTLEDLIES